MFLYDTKRIFSEYYYGDALIYCAVTHADGSASFFVLRGCKMERIFNKSLSSDSCISEERLFYETVAGLCRALCFLDSLYMQVNVAAVPKLFCRMIFLFQGNPLGNKPLKYLLPVALEDTIFLSLPVYVQKNTQIIIPGQIPMTAIGALNKNDLLRVNCVWHRQRHA